MSRFRGVPCLERARLLVVEYGFSVIPVPLPGGRHDGKVPALPWKAYQTRRPTDDELRAWFAREQNIAIVCGCVSDLAVVDVDSADALHFVWRRLPYTPWQAKTSKGFHLYYRWAGRRVPNRARIASEDGRLALDVRGDGGYVIAPGSVHATGVVYDEAGDWSAARDRVPRFWPGWLERPTPRPSPRPVRPATGDVLDRARRYLASIPRPEIGSGSDAATLYAACRLTRGFALSDSDAIALLWQWAGGRPGWTHEWIAGKVAHARRYGTEPIGGLVG
jgi:hypothetical protein